MMHMRVHLSGHFERTKNSQPPGDTFVSTCSLGSLAHQSCVRKACSYGSEISSQGIVFHHKEIERDHFLEASEGSEPG